jgi:endonuclease III
MPGLLPKNQRRHRTETVLGRLRETMPAARNELYYQTPFQLLISVVLSAKVSEKMVNRVMQPLYEQGFTPETVIAWGVEGFLSRIRTIGLAPTKARNVHRISEIVLERFQGEVPATREDLESLPGVGRKTANVILGELFKQPIFAVDTHVFRVTRRLGLHDAPNPDKAERAMLDLVDSRHLPGAHHWFLLHGRYVCKALRPECERCQIRELCPTKGRDPLPN